MYKWLRVGDGNSVDTPVEPTVPMISPLPTTSPTFTLILSDGYRSWWHTSHGLLWWYFPLTKGSSQFYYTVGSSLYPEFPQERQYQFLNGGLFNIPLTYLVAPKGLLIFPSTGQRKITLPDFFCWWFLPGLPDHLIFPIFFSLSFPYSGAWQFPLSAVNGNKTLLEITCQYFLSPCWLWNHLRIVPVYRYPGLSQ